MGRSRLNAPKVAQIEKKGKIMSWIDKLRCERCGKFVKELFNLPHEWGYPLADQGEFCGVCCLKHDATEWCKWLKLKGWVK